MSDSHFFKQFILEETVMQKTTVNDILQKISFLQPEDQYVIAEILSKKVRDLRRKQLVLRAQEAEENDKSADILIESGQV